MPNDKILKKIIFQVNSDHQEKTAFAFKHIENCIQLSIFNRLMHLAVNEKGAKISTANKEVCKKKSNIHSEDMDLKQILLCSILAYVTLYCPSKSCIGSTIRAAIVVNQQNLHCLFTFIF